MTALDVVDLPVSDLLAMTEPYNPRKIDDHRLLCGDSTSVDDVARLLPDEMPQVGVTDPPYGVRHDPAWRKEAAEKAQLADGARRVR